MNASAAFDPGIGSLAVDFNTFINNVYSQMMSFNSIKQKRIRFRMCSSKIYSYLENNIAFFQGCLLWAYYLKKYKSKPPLDIEGNPYLNLSDEEKENYDYLLHINFIENYFDSYERDTLYYTGKKTEIPEKWKKILSIYKEFLELNKGFVKTKTSADIILPSELDKKTFKEDIKLLINKAVEQKNLSLLLNEEI